VVSVAITTAPRPVPTLGTAVASLHAAGGPAPLIVEDTPTHGLVQTWVIALDRLLNEAHAPWVMVMQDDVTWPTDGWATALRGLDALWRTVPRVGYASLHTMPRVQEALRLDATAPAIDTWYPTGRLQPFLHKQRWCGAQCYVLPRGAAVMLLADPTFRDVCRRATRSVDHHVTLALNRLGLPTFTWFPSLVSHSLGKGNRAPRQRAAVRL